MIVLSTVAYGVMQNTVALNIGLTPAQKPTITLTSTLVNTYDNSVTLFVNSTTEIIERTEPAFPVIYMNITNTGITPIDKIIINDSIPANWTLREVRMQLVQADQTIIEIDPTHFTIEYTPENNAIITTSNFKDTLGKNLNQNESIIITLYIKYNLIGEPLPSEYETNPPLYTNTVNIKAWIGSLQSQPANSTLTFPININWI